MNESSSLLENEKTNLKDVLSLFLIICLAIIFFGALILMSIAVFIHFNYE